MDRDVKVLFLVQVGGCEGVGVEGCHVTALCGILCFCSLVAVSGIC